MRRIDRLVVAIRRISEFCSLEALIKFAVQVQSVVGQAASGSLEFLCAQPISLRARVSAVCRPHILRNQGMESSATVAEMEITTCIDCAQFLNFPFFPPNPRF